MMIDRRGFLARMALATAAPVLGALRAQATPIAATQATPIAADVSCVAFMIDGWSIQDDSASGDRVWIRIDRSWRTAWR